MPTIRKRGSRYQAQVRIKQSGLIVHEESATFDTERQALMWGMGVEDSFAKGVIKPKQDVSTLGEAVEHHRKALEKAGKDLSSVKSVLDNLADSKLGRMKIMEVQSGDVVTWAKEYAAGGEDGRSPATVLHALMNLRTVYSTARSELNIKVDVQEVADAIKHLTRLGIAGKSTERDRRVTDAEIDQIATWHEKKQGTTIPLRLAMKLLVALPRRRGEIFQDMRWEHYDGETIKLFDTKDPTKVRNEVVPVPPEARVIIDGLPRSKTGYIMPYKPNSITSAVGKACQMLGIEDLHLHDLRHEGVSRLFEKGLDIPRVALISGHKSWATLKRYTHLKPKDVVDRLTELAT